MTFVGGPSLLGIAAMTKFSGEVLNDRARVPRKGWLALGAELVVALWMVLFVVLSAPTMLRSWTTDGAVDRDERLTPDLRDEGLPLPGVPAHSVDDDRVDLDPKFLLESAAGTAHRTKGGVADDDHVDVSRRRTRFTCIASRPRPEDVGLFHAVDIDERVSEATEHSDRLHEDGTQLIGPRQVPVGGDQGVATQRAGDDQAVLGKTGDLPARGCLGDAGALGELTDGHIGCALPEQDRQDGELLFGPEQGSQGGRRPTHILDDIIDNTDRKASPCAGSRLQR